MAGELRMRLHGKTLCNGKQARDILERELRVSLKKAGFGLQRLLMHYSPVRTGMLRRSWNVSEPAWHGDVFMVKVGSALVYARITAKRGRSAGYDHRALAGAKGDLRAAVQEAIRRAIPQMRVAL